jgi:hypothetical protein
MPMYLIVSVIFSLCPAHVTAELVRIRRNRIKTAKDGSDFHYEPNCERMSTLFLL